ncbi:hypothetical protein B0H17DRAFT_1206037 [Mycena rosella]|uniref:Uncharacterized protein n=1 Tax=Mycena rosella TaxID=1033263 RepID=A0AAD7G9M5_MYCRO|nr:hypothetical protein B0H17DRAFT_1206037 [Mycena rosella]
MASTTDDVDMSDIERRNLCFVERAEEGGLYESVMEQMMNLPNALCNIEFISTKKHPPDLFRAEYWEKNIIFKDGPGKDASEFRAAVIGEIAEPRYGTVVRAQGNNYDGRDGEPFKPVDDKSKVKDVLVLRAPTHCSLYMKNLFDNQSALIQDLENSEIANDEANGWVPATAGAPKVVATPKQVQRVKRKRNEDGDDEAEGANPAETVDPVAKDEAVRLPDDEDIKLSAFYDPRVLEDYGGPYFEHINSKLLQLDIRDAENKLIPPSKQYAALHPGSLIIALVTIHIFTFKDPGSDRTETGRMSS